MPVDELLARLRAQRELPRAAERKKIREGAGASLRDVAKALGVSPAAVHRWEGGKKPGARTLGASPGPLTAAYAALLEELKRLAA